MKKELIGILICTLLVTVAIAPGINALTIQKNEINEVHSQTRTFTEEEINALEELMDDINNGLENAKTWQETVAVLKWAVIELDKFDLLPYGMSIEKAQQLMISIYQSKEASTSDEGTLIANKVCNPVGSSMPFAPLGNGGLIDNVDIYCRGPYLFQIIIRECVFTVSFLNNNNELINLKLEVNVTTPDGTLLFHPGDPFYAWLNPGHEGNVQYWTFIDFRKARHLFGFFDINVKFTVRDDGSERREVFHCLIFGISAIIFNPEGEIIDESIDESGNQNTQSSQQSSSEQDFAELEKLLVDMENRFYTAEDRNERIDIIKETVVLVDEYGQLPSGLSVDHALQLVDIKCMDPEFIEFLDSPYNGNPVCDDGDILTNKDVDCESSSGGTLNSQGTSMNSNENLLSNKSSVLGGQHVYNTGDGLADKVKIKVVKGTWLQTLLRGSVFKVTLWNGNNCTINYYLDVDVTSKKGDVIFELKHDFITDFTPGLLDIIGFWYYIQFRQEGFLFGFFDINVKIQVLEDASIQTKTAHGFIFGISAIIWGGK